MTRHLLDDELNRSLVTLLQDDGRMTHADLAERLGVSRPTVIERVKRLEAAGVIEGYAARVSPAAVGKPTVAFVAVRYRPIEVGGEDRLLAALEKADDVLEAHTVAGEDCILLKVVATDPPALNETLRMIRLLGQQVTTRTTVVLETHFAKAGPRPSEPRPAREEPQ